jgi:hypothetical protein
MFAQYLDEKEGKTTIFTEEGFFVSKILPEHQEFWVCYIFIKPEHRRSGAFKSMMDTIKYMAEVANCKQIIADVDTHHANCEESLKVLIKRGMKIGAIRDNRWIWLYYPLINKTNIQIGELNG